MARIISVPTSAKSIPELLPAMQRIIEELEALRELSALQQEQINELRKKAQESI